MVTGWGEFADCQDKLHSIIVIVVFVLVLQRTKSNKMPHSEFSSPKTTFFSEPGCRCE